MSRARVYLGGFTLALCLVAGAIAAGSVRRAYGRVHPVRVHVTDAEARKAAATLPGLEDVTLHTADGLSLRAWFSPGTRRTAVVLVHGLMGNRAQLLGDAGVLARHGYGVLLYDSRASGDSDGDVATWGDQEQLDVRAAVDYVERRPEIDPARVAVLGFSVGASAVAMACASDPRVRAVILYATWTSLADEIKAKGGRFGVLAWGPSRLVMRAAGVHADRISPIDHVGLIAPRPLLMLAGGKDSDTPLAVMERVFAAAGEPKELVVFPGSDHGAYLKTDPALFEARMTAFLARAFPP